MKWLFRPSTLVLVSAVLALAAAGWLWFSPGGDPRPQPRPVAGDEHEVAWLYAATNAAAWERFVSAVHTAATRLKKERPGFELDVDESNAFPPQTTAVPELAVSVRGASGRLLFRWYKLTSEWKIADWVQALLARPRPPLAIVGGSSSDLAIDLAQQMAAQGQDHGEAAPLLLVTNATAVPVNGFYPGRTFRFCFNNRRMAQAVTDFIWSQDDLRPDMDPVYVTMWEDDPYSTDLTRSFYDALKLPGTPTGGAPPGAVPYSTLDPAGGEVRMSARGLPTPQKVSSSVGGFDRPNRFELEAAQFLLGELDRQPGQLRPLLVLPGQTNPTRRFLRALGRTAPVEARRFVVAAGDAIAFNTIYRDRNVAWPIQDLPFTLVLFCHRNPVDGEAGFLPVGAPRPEGAEGTEHSATGTEDLLLYEDIVEALVQAAFQGGTGERPGNLLANAGQLRQRLTAAVLADDRVAFGQSGPALFDANGDRQSGTGEHVVCLRPKGVRTGRILPEATIEIWYWQAGADGQRRWQRREQLQVPYDGSPLNEVP